VFTVLDIDAIVRALKPAGRYRPTPATLEAVYDYSLQTIYDTRETRFLSCKILT